MSNKLVVRVSQDKPYPNSCSLCKKLPFILFRKRNQFIFANYTKHLEDHIRKLTFEAMKFQVILHHVNWS